MRRLISLILIGILLLGTISPTLAQEPEPDPAERLLDRMSPEARVGQLFIVTFPNTDVAPATDIYQLIVEERIGGVLLQPDNGNIINQGDTPRQLATLTTELQRLAWEATQVPTDTAELIEERTTPAPNTFIPLFIAVEQAGNGTPFSSVVSGTTLLPSPMGIGATWNPNHAETVGTIVGSELSAMGVNMLLGPSLDVLITPRPGSPADLGTQSFGGDPYWVGQMGEAYVRGVHSGSEGQIAVVPGHFPGLGAADRPPSEEISTVPKSLEQLKQIELAPFFTAAGSEDPMAQPDGLLVSHIRYRGFQGNIRSTTKPVSFDPQALQQLMALPELATWRTGGGLTVADALGARAVRRFYDATEQEFKNRSIALDAFVAGNDLLILSHFALSDDWDAHMANIRDTLAFFRDKYETDPTFQGWVDEAVLRILRTKLRLYDSTASLFLPEWTEVDPETVADQVGQSRELVSPIARDAVTLLSPPSPDLRPAPPAADEAIVIFTDDRVVSPCDGCEEVPAVPTTLLEETLIRLYGPQATNQVFPTRINSFTFTALEEYLSAPSPALLSDGTPAPPDPVGANLQQADWVLFAMIDIDDDVPSSDTVRRFLAERADLLQDKRVVVFALGAPYYLDTTEIAKLSAYFGIYSRTTPAVEAALRALFDEFPFTGAAPVSVPGINYDIIAQTQPDPAQTIQILYEVVGREEEGSEETTPTPAPTPQTLEIFQGDTLRLQTNEIVDRNGNPVPDGTPAEFIFTYPQEGLEHSVAVTTQDGVAQTNITLDRVGQLRVSIRAEPVPRAVRLEVDIREGEPAVVVPITPTPTPTPTPTVTPTAEPTPVRTPTPAVETEPEEEIPATDWDVGWRDLLLSIAIIGTVAIGVYAVHWQQRRDLVSALRIGLWSIAGGLAAYIFLALETPGSQWLREQAGELSTVATAFLGAAAPVVVSVVLKAIQGKDPLQRIRWRPK
jgi:beta-N-acetylhexosaminidase